MRNYASVTNAADRNDRDILADRRCRTVTARFQLKHGRKPPAVPNLSFAPNEQPLAQPFQQTVSSRLARLRIHNGHGANVQIGFESLRATFTSVAGVFESAERHLG